MASKYLLVCADPLAPRQTDPAFATDVEAGITAGFTVVVVDHDCLDIHVLPDRALRHARFEQPGSAIYRGWMLTPTAYLSLFQALFSRGINLVTTPGEYEACHHTPGSLERLAAWMPETRLVPFADIDDGVSIALALDQFDGSAVIVKDWVKSQAAGYWSEACFIPDASDRASAIRVIDRFRHLQGEGLVGGLVLKSYKRLVPVGGPADEHRAFAVKGSLIGCWPRYHGQQDDQAPPQDMLRAVALAVPSPFASMDFGVDDQGDWWLLEVGDGQVSELPPDAANTVFRSLAIALG